MVNGDWGWQVGETKWKSAEEIRALLESANGKGANLLLNIGPQPDGRLPRPALGILESRAVSFASEFAGSDPGEMG